VKFRDAEGAGPGIFPRWRVTVGANAALAERTTLVEINPSGPNRGGERGKPGKVPLGTFRRADQAPRAHRCLSTRSFPGLVFAAPRRRLCLVLQGEAGSR